MATRRLPRAHAHPQRKEIARYLLSRGAEELDGGDPGPIVAFVPPDGPGRRTIHHVPDVVFPDGLAPVAHPLAAEPTDADPLPQADVVVITWTADEARALAHVLTPGYSASRSARHHWHAYTHNFSAFEPLIRGGAPAHSSKRLASFLPVTVGARSVLVMKSELHLNQDGIRTGDGTATLPVKDMFKQIISEAQPSLVLTIGTAGSVHDAFGLGDVVVTRAARFWLGQELKNEPYNGATYTSNWEIPTTYLAQAEAMMTPFVPELAFPPIGFPTVNYAHADTLTSPLSQPAPAIRLDGAGDLPEFHPILTTDWFEYGTSENRLDQWGAGVEMGDAALGLAVEELDTKPDWAVVRNMSDPVINGALPANTYHLNEQTTWAVGYYTAYGIYTSINGAIATWGIIAGLP